MSNNSSRQRRLMKLSRGTSRSPLALYDTDIRADDRADGVVFCLNTHTHTHTYYARRRGETKSHPLLGRLPCDALFPPVGDVRALISPVCGPVGEAWEALKAPQGLTPGIQDTIGLGPSPKSTHEHTYSKRAAADSSELQQKARHPLPRPPPAPEAVSPGAATSL